MTKELAMFLGPLVFSAGGLVVTLKTVADSGTKIEAKLEQHVAAPGHAGQEERMRAMQEATRRNEVLLRELAAQINRVDDNVISLCQATKGANCVRGR